MIHFIITVSYIFVLYHRYSHPYGYELDMYEPLEEHMRPVEPRPARPIADTPCKYVDSEESLKNMLNDLKGYKEIAIDVEVST
jgi:exosome complex exonuclease RRP6